MRDENKHQTSLVDGKCQVETGRFEGIKATFWVVNPEKSLYMDEHKTEQSKPDTFGL